MSKKLSLLLSLALPLSCWGQNYLDNYLSGSPTYTTIANSGNSVSEPRDLDFKPNTNELWVANKGNSDGSSVIIIYNAGQSNQRIEYRKDSHSGHFMMYGAAIAFGDNGNWGCVSEIKNTASPSSTFMGPALWNGDTAIFASVFQNNWENGKPLGSHLDMLHQSPFGMGIAHDSANAYWVYDGYFANLCKYDFGKDHSPGYDDHSNGRIWRYTDITLGRVPDVPSHMIKDKASGWLYLVDGVNKRLKRVNTNTGSILGNLSVPGTSPEPLLGYWSMTGATVQVLDSFNAGQPSGIDLYNGRLIVGDYATGMIHIYNISGATPVKLGTISTGQTGIMGLKIGADGRIWFVNNTANTVVRIEAASNVAVDALIDAITAPKLYNSEVGFYNERYNICNPAITPVVTLKNNGTSTLTSATINYRIDNGTTSSFSWTGSLATGASANVTLPATTTVDGGHKLRAWVTAPNGGTDMNPANDTKEGSFRVKSPVVNYPYNESFTATTFPPAGWTYIGFNFHNEVSHDASVGAWGSNNGSLVMDNYSEPEDITGQKDYLMLPRINMSGANASAKLGFTYAYARYDGSTNDGLAVRVSSDCGLNWTEIFNKSGASLSTVSDTRLTEFTPVDSEWRSEVVPVSAYAGQSDVMFMFVLTSAHGNNLYLDNVAVTANLDVPGATVARPRIYPNPSTGIVAIELTTANSSLQVTDVLGRQVMSMDHMDQGKHQIDLSNQSNGTYLLTVQSEAGSFRQKVSIIK